MVSTRTPDAFNAPELTTTRTRRSRWSRGHVLMVAAGLAGGVLTFALLRGADGRDQFAIAAHDLEPGTVLDAADVRWTDGTLDSGIPVLQPNELDAYVGHVVVRPIAAGELVSPHALLPESAPDGLRAVSVPIDKARAVNGDLAPGDRVDVLLAGDTGAAVVVAAAKVLDVNDHDGGALGGAQQFSITLAVDEPGARALADALADGDVLLARSTGAVRARGSESATDAP